MKYKFRIHNLLMLTGILTLALFSGRSLQAHFLWLKPLLADGNAHGVISFGESPFLENGKLPDSIQQASMWWRDKSGGIHKLTHQLVESEERMVLRAALPNEGARVLEATCDYGIYQDSLLKYYAKSVIVESVDQLGVFGRSKALDLDLIPSRVESGVAISISWKGEPLPNASIALTDSLGNEIRQTSDEDGKATFQISNEGLISVVGFFTQDDVEGEYDGEEYGAVMNYTTLTFGWSTQDPTGNTGAKRDQELPADNLPNLPTAVSSFGAAVHSGWLYVYSGHTGKAHAHSTKNLSSQFIRISLAEDNRIENLELENALQGFPLVSYRDNLYRVGGMYAKNLPNEIEDLHSISDFRSFNTETKEWTQLPSLPVARSSHDAVVLDGKLYVFGGWNLDGSDDGDWTSTPFVFDLDAQNGTWQELPQQPFERRAIAVSHWKGKLVVLGGIDSENELSHDFDLYDPNTRTWSKGPIIPGKRMSGFGISAWNESETLWIVGLEGVVYRLAENGQEWNAVTELKTARFFHRLLPAGSNKLLVVGGASIQSGHLSDIELINIDN